MLAEIDGCGFVGGGFVVDNQFVAVGQRVGDSDLHISGEAVVAVLAEVGVGDASFAFQWLAVPNNFVESLIRAAVERVGSIVLRQRVGLAVEGEGAVGNTVGVATDHGADVRRIRDIAFEVLVAEDDIGELAFAVGNTD